MEVSSIDFLASEDQKEDRLVLCTEEILQVLWVMLYSISYSYPKKTLCGYVFILMLQVYNCQWLGWMVLIPDKGPN